ncbi:MAG: cereblon family protein [Gammaproteobacteria bacterium]
MLFDAPDAGRDGGSFAPWSTTATTSGVDTRRWRVRCGPCRHVLAAPAWRVRVAGEERHVHTNPLGFSFVLRLYDAAPGCRARGAPTSTYSWFPPLAWQVLACGGCGEHRGWSFAEAGAQMFVALVVDGIVEEIDA